ncbi:formin-like protein [Galendromus occidentalis]|uniref:Formin-like protein n=1 Tax=Galendromus occidentalis TaxID=34638 RepID=A0AAJ7SD69_9ACAR|nr:formin-like protein [Galendromus occidentalis]
MGHGVSHHQASGERWKNNAEIKQPMPDEPTVEKRFNEVLNLMDLPPDKAKVLKNYDSQKKWEIVCDQEKMTAKQAPSFYLSKLTTYLDPKAPRSTKVTTCLESSPAAPFAEAFYSFFHAQCRVVYLTIGDECFVPMMQYAPETLRRRTLGNSKSTQILRDLEISLRTNNIEWVREFLNEDNKGLEVLIDYLSFQLEILKFDLGRGDTLTGDDGPQSLGYSSVITTQSAPSLQRTKSLGPYDSPTSGTPKLKRRPTHKQLSRLNMGEAEDDIHVCIMCLRAIMNNKYGFNMVIEHTQAINCIALSLNHKSLRTKALVLELLAAICLVKGGHPIILSAFDNFKVVCGEQFRFQTLMEYFRDYTEFNIDFMVACMQFINIVVHSVEDMNFRVYLQYEFTQLGLENYLDKIGQTESEELQVQISAYWDNFFDVHSLMEDSETKAIALDRVAELEHLISRSHEIENELMAKLVDLETENVNVRRENEDLLTLREKSTEEINTLRKKIHDKDKEYTKRQSVLESKLQQLENGSISGGSSTSSPVPPPGATTTLPAPAPPPPPPPPPPMSAPAPPPPPMPTMAPGGMFVPPPPPPMAGNALAPHGAVTIRRTIKTKHKLPTLNWVALRPTEVNGTVFKNLDDDKLYTKLAKRLDRFEELFKLGPINGSGGSDRVDRGEDTSSRKLKPEKVTKLGHKRLQNMAICRRKFDLPSDAVVKLINNLDPKALSVDQIETLLRMMPTETEAKDLKQYEREHKTIDELEDEDKFLLQLTKVERLEQKLSIMLYMTTFQETLNTMTPQIHAITLAARTVKSSKRMSQLLELILLLGNMMNGAKRGHAYGFKLQSLDILPETKTADKKMSLLHYIMEFKDEFPEIVGVEQELRVVEKAAQVPLENLIVDQVELEKGMERCRKEFALRKDNLVLRDFLAQNEEKLQKLLSDVSIAKEAYAACVEYFGESARTVPSNTFFATLLRFLKNAKQAELDNERRRVLEETQRAKSLQNNNNNNVQDSKRNQEAVINELKSRTKQVKEKKKLPQDEVYHGALEDILNNLKSEPYVRADALRRSQRRKYDTSSIVPNHDGTMNI